LRRSTPFRYVSDSEKEAHFVKLVSENKGRKIIIVVAPYHKSYLQPLEGREEAAVFFNKIKQLKNVYVLDYGDAPYADSLFKNTTHLNYLGAKKFSIELKGNLHAFAPEYF
jgi:hypothetical protein